MERSERPYLNTKDFKILIQLGRGQQNSRIKLNILNCINHLIKATIEIISMKKL